MVDAEIRRGVPYLHRADKELRADIYQPPCEGGMLPAVVYIHGGGWRRGGREDYAADRLLPLVEQGIVVVSISYRFSHEAVWPAQVADAADAVRWVLGQADELWIDSSRVSVWGASAGGHLASFLAMVSGRTALGMADPFPVVHSAVSFFAPFDLLALRSDPPDEGAVLPRFALGRPPDPERAEEALVGASAATHAADRLRSASPNSHVAPTAAPLLMLHGTADAMIPLAQPRRMATALADAGVRHQLLLVDGATHEDPAFHTPAVLGAVARWITT
jgi:acetyl esterase/lipase